MVVRFRKKVRRQRGNRWHGWGGKKKHRGGGSQGGKGLGGLRKHKRSFLYANRIDHFGKRGFVRRSLTPRKERAINIDSLRRFGKGHEINLADFGYDKLLGRGTVNKAYTIIVEKASKSAAEKIEEAGGKIILERGERERGEAEEKESRG